jgi:Peptidase family M1 domain
MFLKTKIIVGLLSLAICLNAQPDRWQQSVEYKMNIDFDAKSHQFSGTQNLVYYNNSPDGLNKVFYHLYFNAFQPGSMMDVRSSSLSDGDPRIASKIPNLKENEIGFQKIKSLKQDGKDVQFEVVGTILEVTLNQPIPPNSKTTFDMEFESQVPIQIRRSGRDNAEGVDYSMSQWYPKLCEYDYQGWHANPYIGREFYGVWGDFDVTINIDKDFTVAASGYLQNPDEIGHGYESNGVKVKTGNDKKLSWRFVAPNVHDFVWAADTEYTHIKKKAADGVVMHFFYIKTRDNQDEWEKLPDVMDRVFSYTNKKFGKYPYEKYSFIQGGDGGMEYPMATLITGNRNFGSLVGVSVHELLHSWYQMVLGTNESLYAWMDEGFTSYASADIMNYLKKEGLLGKMKPIDNPHESTIGGYVGFSKSGLEEPLSTHADHFISNSAYGVGSYVKGSVFLNQLSYIIGNEAFEKGILKYFNTWKFKHPNPNDFIRIMEKESGLELDWYKEYWINTTNTIDYAVKSVTKENKKTTIIELEKIGVMPMPLDVVVTYKKGEQEVFNIPLRIMRGEKKQEFENMKYTVAEDWPWTNPTYILEIPSKLKNVEKVEIDPSIRMADVERENNSWKK